VEFARHVAGLEGAHSTEMDPNTPHPVVDLMEDQRHVADKGATMRLGAYACELAPGSHAARAYGLPVVWERHRHRYEVNNAYRERLRSAGLVFSGRNPEQDLVEIVELPVTVHPWFVAVQFHPEFQSKPNRAHPLFTAFVAAAIDRRRAAHRT
jgi:CTP synthase (EC 6.3.4.2)